MKVKFCFVDDVSDEAFNEYIRGKRCENEFGYFIDDYFLSVDCKPDEYPGKFLLQGYWVEFEDEFEYLAIKLKYGLLRLYDENSYT
jgi:hypothetical protein